MHRPLLIAIVITLCFIFVTILAKCPCGCSCWRWCSCVKSNEKCCCNESRENMTINLTRVVRLHFTNWCPACKIMKPIWEQVKIATAGSGIVFEEIDEDIAKTSGINGIPTIRMIDENGRMSEYAGGPHFETLRNWIVSPIVYHA